MFKGIAGSEGIGIGIAAIIEEADLTFENRQIEDVEAEKARFSGAIASFKEKTSAMRDRVKETIGEKEAGILNGQLVMIEDPAMTGEMEKLIEAGNCAEAAVDNICEMFAGMFEAMDDELMQQRATDLRDIKTKLICNLKGIEQTDIGTLPEGSIIVAGDLTPSMTSQIVKESIEGIVTRVGGKTSHSAIMARAMEIPAVLSVPEGVDAIKNGDQIIVDGDEGTIIINPAADVLEDYQNKKKEQYAQKEKLKSYIGKPTLTGDGSKCAVYCNIGTPQEATGAMEGDGEGIGLFRTEFLFMNNTKMPTEQEQFEAYKKTAETMEGREVIIRTLDIGGDKDIPYMNIEKEDNPFLGYRAIRYCLGNEDFYRTQLRAIIRASAFGKIRIMVPLVTCIEELLRVKELVAEIKAQLSTEGIDFDKDIKVGVMMETASAALVADLFAKHADFFSIGTNDLTGYVMEVDRGNTNVSYLYSAFHPSVLRAIRNIIVEGKKAGIPVGMCGEMAADPMMIPLLIAFGLDEFSVTPVKVLATRAAIGGWDKKECEKIAEKVLSFETEKEVLDYLKDNH